MIKVLVIDDHGVVRQGIKQILSQTSDISVGGDASTGAEGIAQAESGGWDAILLDLALPDNHGLDVLKELRRSDLKVPILVLSMHPEDQFALRAIRAGASGYLTKNGAVDELASAIRTVVSGRHYLSPWLADRLAREASGDPSKPPHELLSDREYEVLMRIASGKTTKDIASEFKISPKTIGTYRMRLAKKMGLTTDSELTAYVFRHRLLE